MSKEKTEAANYYSMDFEWEQLRDEVETDTSFLYHLLPFIGDDDDVDKNVENSVAAEKGSVKDSSRSSSLEDSDAWDKFDSRHFTGKFFKERRYLLKEFPELAYCTGHSKVLEVGCGNDSTALPILRVTENIVVYACDCRNEALDRAKENASAANLILAERCFLPFLYDVSVCGFPEWLACSSCQERFANAGDLCQSLSSEERTCCIGGLDFVTLIFTLSALSFHRMPMAVKECFSVLKTGGILLFRDFGFHDMTMIRLYPEQRVGYREYMQSDGTRSYFFSLECTRDLFSSVGFKEVGEEEKFDELMLASEVGFG